MSARRMDMLLKMMRLFGAETLFSNYGDMDRPTEMLKNLLLNKKA